MSFLKQAAKYYVAEPHQDAAWDELAAALPSYLLEEFITSYRGSPTPVVNLEPNSWDGIYHAAKECGAAFPQVAAAQWALESAWGKHTSGKNNFFGIKGKGTIKTTWEDYGNGPVTIQDEFKDFDSPAACIEYLVTKWYKDYKGYKGVNRAYSYEECARLLKTEGYATDPKYSDKLIRIIKDHG